MPLCVSCRGEYWVPSRDRQAQAETSGTPYMAELYGLSALPPYECARCRQSNEQWHEWVNKSGLLHFNRFFLHNLPWGWLAALSFLLPLFAAQFLDFTPVASERIGIPLAVLLIFVNLALLYALRDSLWRYDLLARVAGNFRPPLALLAVITFVMALLLGLIIVFMLEARAANPELGRTEGLVRVTATIILALAFVNVALSAIFMTAHDYGNWLNREMPQPLYAQERRLWKVIEDNIQERIRQATSKDIKVETTIMDLERTADGGIIVLISAETSADQISEQGTLKQVQSWKITADRWGRILKMNAEGIPHYFIIESTLAKNGAAKPDPAERKPIEERKAEPISGEVIFPEDRE